MSDTLHSQVRFLHDEAKVTLRLRLEAGYDPRDVTESTLRALLTEKSVADSTIVGDGISSLVSKAAGEPGETHEATVAEGQAAVDGNDARFVFEDAVEEKLERIREREQAARTRNNVAPGGAERDRKGGGGEDESDFDFYNDSAFVIVAKGDKIGKLEPATTGEDGQDVYGAVLAAKGGKSTSLDIKRSVRVTENGVAVAAVAGRLYFDGSELRVDETLEIPGAVDFSTGNIDFPGNVSVGGGVKDNFVVSSRADVSIRELVQASTLKVDGDLHIEGMAGRDMGTIETRGSLRARYLDGVQASVGKHLEVTKEISGGEVRVIGRVESPAAVFRGGRLFAGQRIELGQLGGEGEVETEVYLGCIEELERLLAPIAEMASKITERRDEAGGFVKTLEQQANPKTASGRNAIEMLASLQFVMDTSMTQLKQLSAGVGTSAAAIRQRTTTCLAVKRTIFPGTAVYMRGWQATFRQPLKGPVLFEFDSNNRPIARLGTSGDAKPLDEVCTLVSDDSLARLDVLDRIADEAA
ncbi:MAG: FapA family protein [Planctomycetota bacterium]